MSFLTKLKVFSVRRTYFILKCVRALWSRLYRRAHRKKYSVAEDTLPYGLLTPEAATTRVLQLKYSPDGWRELWDAVGSAERAQYALDKIERGLPQPAMAMDCDDFAAWCLEAINPEFVPQIVSIAWTDNGKIKGHAICVFRPKVNFREDKMWTSRAWGHTGNWGMMSPYGSFSEMLEATLRRTLGEDFSIYSKDPNRQLVAWAITHKDGLMPRKCGYTAPDF